MATTKVTVTGLTAPRMLQIEAQSIVSGSINSSGHLILKNHAGATFDVGSVQGPIGATGATGAAGSLTMVNGKSGGSVTLTAADVGAVPTTSQASTIAKGLVELATSAEVIGGADSTRAVVPSTLNTYMNQQLPVGLIVIGTGTTDVANYFVADGRSLYRDSYPELFAVCGTRFGSSGSTTFNIPNLKGRIVVGRDANQTEFDTIGEVGGSKTHGHILSKRGQALVSIQAVSGQTITMSRVATDGTASTKFDGGTVGAIGSSNDMATGAALAGSTDAASSLQPYAVMNYFIKYT